MQPDLSNVSTLSRSWCNVLCDIFSAFISVSLIIFPWVIEIILITQQLDQAKLITLIVCGSVQTIISIFGGFMMGFEITKSKDARFDCSFFHNPGLSYKYFLNPHYIITILIPWILTNMIISWVLNSHNHLPVYVHIMVYMPILIYLPLLFMGCAFVKSINIQYDQYKEITQIPTD